LSTRAEFLERFAGSANHNSKLESVAIYNSFDATVLGRSSRALRTEGGVQEMTAVEAYCAYLWPSDLRHRPRSTRLAAASQKAGRRAAGIVAVSRGPNVNRLAPWLRYLGCHRYWCHRRAASSSGRQTSSEPHGAVAGSPPPEPGGCSPFGYRSCGPRRLSLALCRTLQLPRLFRRRPTPQPLLPLFGSLTCTSETGGVNPGTKRMLAEHLRSPVGGEKNTPYPLCGETRPSEPPP
jgi:hypothetical protein